MVRDPGRGTTVVDYLAARGMDLRPSRRKAFLWLAVVANLGLLGFFKYFNFFVDNLAAVLAAAGWQVPRPALDVALPVGISFYTFQALSYVIDVYWRRTPARRSLVDVSAFIAFFPSLLAGPIMRAATLLPQIERERRFSAPAARDATLLLAWGFFKKLVIADNVGVIADKVFALRSPEFFVLWAGVFAFCIQIYADFSAYADIARGVAKWLGIDLIRNFEHPYLATGPTDFWRRWNISLSTWFRDYVFLPVAYRLSDSMPSDRRILVDTATWAYVGGMIVTMLAAGLWHGASWNYVIWGAYHGVLLALARIAGARAKTPAAAAPLAHAPADRRDVRAHQPRMAVLPRNGTARRSCATSACRHSSQPSSDGGPAPTCSSSRRCTRSRSGCRACGPNWAGATSWRR